MQYNGISIYSKVSPLYILLKLGVYRTALQYTDNSEIQREVIIYQCDFTPQATKLKSHPIESKVTFANFKINTRATDIQQKW